MTESPDQLAQVFPRGSRLYTIMVGRSRSGMVRRYRVFAVIDGRIGDLTYSVARRIEKSYRDDSLEMRGTGYNATQSIAADLSLALHGDVSAIGGESL